ncbi:MAG: pyridoxamine 5'-phosphate oxidase family protein [Ilumatobacteraceae bacterium]
MALDLDRLDDAVIEFLRERHLATLTTSRVDGSPHVVPVGFGYAPTERLVRIITVEGSQKVRNADRGGRAAVSQVDGGRWLTLEGPVRVRRDPTSVERAVEAYAARYRDPSPRDARVAIEILVDRILGRV